MHTYSVNKEERKNVSFILATISVVSSFVFHKIIEYFQLPLTSYIGIASVPFFYKLFFSIFDQWLWRFFQSINLIKTPNLDGNWKGSLKSSFDNHSDESPATLEISQTWTKIKIKLETDKSSSDSESASIVIDDPKEKRLSYQYMNKPKPSADKDMHIHNGTATLSFNKKQGTLKGEYYSGRGRQKYGILSFTRDNADT